MGNKGGEMAGESSMTPAELEAAVQEKIKELKLVPESDLLAVKAGREGLQQKLQETEAAHKTQLSELLNKQLIAEAKATELEEKYNSVSATAKELETIKPQLETAQNAVRSLGDRALEYRRKIVALTYNIPVATVENKTLEQLDSYEEALKAVSASRGIGNYAAGAGAGGGVRVETPHERALRVIQEAEEKRGYAIRTKEKEKVT